MDELTHHNAAAPAVPIAQRNAPTQPVINPVLQREEPVSAASDDWEKF